MSANRWNTNHRGWIATCTSRAAMMAYVRIALVAGLGACATSRGAEPVAETGPVSNLLAQAAAEAGVPLDLLTAIAAEEGGLQLAPIRFVDPDDNVPIGGMLELRH